MKNDFLLLAGSTPGPVKRLVALREPARKTNENAWKISGIEFISTQGIEGAKA